MSRFVAQLHEELEALRVPPTGLGNKELAKQLSQLEADKEADDDILQDFPMYVLPIYMRGC